MDLLKMNAEINAKLIKLAPQLNIFGRSFANYIRLIEEQATSELAVKPVIQFAS